MLLRNIDQGLGFHFRLTNLCETIIGAITLNGFHHNQKVLTPRVNMIPLENQ